LDLSNGGSANGTKIQLWDDQSGNQNQIWTITYSGRDSITLKNKKGGNVLDLSGSNPAPGTVVSGWSSQNSPNQMWILTKGDGNSWNMQSSATGTFLDVSGGGTANGTQIQCWTRTGGANQRWIFIKV